MNTIDALHVLIGVVCAYRCGILADARGRRAWLWRVLGFAGGVIPLFVLSRLKPVQDQPATVAALEAGAAAGSTAH